MWGSLSFNSVSSRARAAIGKLRGAITRHVAEDEIEDVEDISLTAGTSLNKDEFGTHSVETADGQNVQIYVSKPSEPAYFNEVEEYAPTIVGTVKQEEVEEINAEPVKKERFVATEPADLFINALRRPVRQRFDTSAPVIKKKAAVPEVFEAPVIEEPFIEAPAVAAAPAQVEVVPTIEKVVVEEAVAVSEEIVTLSEAPEIPEVTITAVMEAPAVVKKAEPVLDEALLVALENEEAKIDSEMSHEVMVDEVPVTVEEAEPIVAAPVVVVPSMPKKFDMGMIEPIAVEEAEPIVAAVDEKEVAFTSSCAVEAPIMAADTVITTEADKIELSDESEILLAFRPELDSDRNEFISTSYDDNMAFREDKLDATERTFKIRASSVTPKYRFDGNLRSLRF